MLPIFFPQRLLFCCLFGLFLHCGVQAQTAVVSSIKPSDLAEFDQQPEAVQKLIKTCLGLTSKNLAYAFGSADPSNGNMDCSGAIQYAIKQQGVEKVPRMSHTFYLWIQEHGRLKKISQVYSPDHTELSTLKPGDLLFWEGTYDVGKRQPPISHVMMYLGKLKSDGNGVMFGSSSGRRFRGKKIHGVSVFDFKVPNEKSKASLVGFGPVPGMRPIPTPAVTTDKKSTTDNPKPLKKLLKVFSKKDKT